MLTGKSPAAPQPANPVTSTPAVQVSLQPAMVASTTAKPAATQTIQAPQAAGRADPTKRTAGAPDTGHAKNAEAHTINSLANGPSYSGQSRGLLLDITA